MLRRLTPANAIAALALFLALSGSAVAGTLVTGADVKDSSLTGRDIKNGTVTGKDVKDGSLTTADFRPGQLPGTGAGPAGGAGPVGPEGERGPSGPRGDEGAHGDKGERGDRGEKGDPGAKGEKGDPGASGAKGEKGDPGASGAKGEKGDPGAKGEKGDPGPRGDVGPPGTVETSKFYDKAAADARFLPATGKAADADEIDGLDSADLARGGTLGTASLVAVLGAGSRCQDLQNTASVTVDVGPSGLVAVYAEAAIQDTGSIQAEVQLYEPTSLGSCPTILRGITGVGDLPQTIRTTARTDSGTNGIGSPLMVRVTPGRRTFSLRYGASQPQNPTGAVVVRAPVLWVQPL